MFAVVSEFQGKNQKMTSLELVSLFFSGCSMIWGIMKMLAYFLVMTIQSEYSRANQRYNNVLERNILVTRNLIFACIFGVKFLDSLSGKVGFPWQFNCWRKCREVVYFLPVMQCTVQY